jgi:acyl-coenzyme A synthetase/AMP-(fatty) acid ligase
VLYVTLSETAEELRAVAATHGWSLEKVSLFELVSESGLDPDSEQSVLHPSEVYWKDNALVPAFARDGWHMTGDSGYVDEHGNLFFVGRCDDIISSSGYRIGPTEVENALMRHPSVQDCAVTSSPDQTRGEVVKAYVVLRPDASGSDRLARDLQDFIKREIAPYKYPRQIEFVSDLPRTPSARSRGAPCARAIRRAHQLSAENRGN